MRVYTMFEMFSPTYRWCLCTRPHYIWTDSYLWLTQGSLWPNPCNQRGVDSHRTTSGVITPFLYRHTTMGLVLNFLCNRLQVGFPLFPQKQRNLPNSTDIFFVPKSTFVSEIPKQHTLGWSICTGSHDGLWAIALLHLRPPQFNSLPRFYSERCTILSNLG